MKELTILDLSLNSLGETVPASIGDLALLKKIDLSWNKLGGAPPPKLGIQSSGENVEPSHPAGILRFSLHRRILFRRRRGGKK